MAGPNAREVDRVSVRVLPDTSKFAAELRAQLAKITRGIEVRIPVRVDTKGVSQAAAQVQAALPKDPFPSFNLDLGPTERLIARILVRLHELPGQVQQAAQRTREFAGHLRSAAQRALNVRNHWRSIGAGITSAAQRIRDIRADGLYRNFLRIGDAIAGATGRLGRFGATAVRALSRAGSSAGRGLQSVLSGIGSAASSAASALGNISRGGFIAIGVFTLAAPAIGIVATLLAGLPSLIAAVGAAGAALALGWDGVKKAASQLTPQVDKLKASLSATFERGLTPVFQQLGAVFPVLDKGLTKVAGGLVVMAQSFTDVVTSKQGLQQIQSILDNTGKFFEQLAPMVRDATSAFLTLADAGAKQFGLLAGVLNTFAADFRSMVERVTSDGSFAAGMQGLAAITSSVLSLFVKLFEAGIRVMAEVGGPVAALIDSLGNALVALMPALASITNLFANVLSAALDAIVPVIQELMPSFRLLAETIGTILVGAIKAVQPILVPLAKILNDVLLMALKAIAPILPPLIQFLTELAQVVGTFLLQALTELTPLLQLTFDTFTQIMMALTPLLPVLTQLASTILTGLLQVLTPLIPPLMQIAQVLFPALVQIVQAAVPVVTQILTVLGELVPIIADIANAIGTILVPIFEAVLEVVQRVWPSIRQIIEGALRAIQGVIDLVMGIIRGDWSRAWDGLKQILSGAWEAIKGAVKFAIDGLIAFFVDLPGAILRALGNLGSLLWDAGKAIIKGLLDGLKAAVGAIWDFVKGIGSEIANLKGPLPYDRRLLIPAGNAIMQGLHKGLVQGFTPVQRLVAGMGDQLAGSVGGSQWGNTWAQGIEDNAPRALRAMDAVSKSAATGVSAQWQTQIGGEDFGSIGDRVGEALTGWNVEIDGNGLAKLVNKSNLRKARRG